ncbi:MULTISPECIES: hypothetical protein [Bacillus amyloliquefaciens group]|uniref:hypothetical protein n=1 Tax=Bacillus amyloliquefaciens group TaxID=1938374 RepID=UPI00052A6F8C|nr:MULTISPECIES: hypothetical protein [Bacillus amyloliquefaciens group]AIU76249.1 hypothetical protein MA22_06780 [Bacillus subtilis]APH47586.1 hypothetical protein BSF20_03795 [Bacillus amyloliquefaciens]AXT11447.1 hypothetical protein D0U03_02985 [Bacillus velezensis]KTF59590.1 hypothetical protein AR691_15175 [Bacillus amyloliquefaciens]MDM5203747.1 hypothetical protein [Bacillus velezensis]
MNKVSLNNYFTIEKYNNGCMVRTIENSFYIKGNRIYKIICEILDAAEKHNNIRDIISYFSEDECETVEQLLKLLIKQKVLLIEEIERETKKILIDRPFLSLYGGGSSYKLLSSWIKNNEQQSLRNGINQSSLVYVCDEYDHNTLLDLFKMEGTNEVLVATSISGYGIVGWFTFEEWNYLFNRITDKKVPLHNNNNNSISKYLSILCMKQILSCLGDNKENSKLFYAIDPFNLEVSTHPIFMNKSIAYKNWLVVDDKDLIESYELEEIDMELIQDKYIGVLNNIEPEKLPQIPVPHLSTIVKLENNIDPLKLVGYGKSLADVESSLTLNIIRNYFSTKYHGEVWSSGRNLVEFLEKGILFLLLKETLQKDEIICRPLNLEAYEWDKNDELNSQYNLLIKRINKPFNVYKMVLEVKNISFLLFTDHNNEKFISYGKNIHDSLLYGFLELISRFQLAYEDEYKKISTISNEHIHYVDGTNNFRIVHNLSELNDVDQISQIDWVKQIKNELKEKQIFIKYSLQDVDPVVIKSKVIIGQLKLDREKV